jgi:hypothetical protein
MANVLVLERGERAVIGAYHAVYFEDVGSAVEFCHDIVPHITPEAAELSGDARPVVWFHVPKRSTDVSPTACYLLLSSGAVHIARIAGLDVPVSGIIPRASLPREAVLIFGEDTLQRHPEIVRRRTVRTAAARVSPVRSGVTDLIVAPS